MTSLIRRVYYKEPIYQRENMYLGSEMRAWLSKARSIQPQSNIEQGLLYLWDGWTFIQAINTIYESDRIFILLLQPPQIHKPIYIQIT